MYIFLAMDACMMIQVCIYFDIFRLVNWIDAGISVLCLVRIDVELKTCLTINMVMALIILTI